MDIFQTLKDDGHFSGDFLDKNLIQFCFLNLVQVCNNLLRLCLKANLMGGAREGLAGAPAPPRKTKAPQ